MSAVAVAVRLLTYCHAMAALPVIPGTSRVAFEWGPLKAVNVMHFHQDDINVSGLAGAIDSNVTAGMWNGIATTQTCNQLSITPLDGTSQTVTFPTGGTAKWKGQSTGDSVPAQCYVLSLHTLFRGRRARGRVFLGPCGESGVTAGITDITGRNNLITAWTAFQVALTDDQVEHVVASYLDKTALTVTGYSCRAAAGTLRPRQSRLAT